MDIKIWKHLIKCSFLMFLDQARDMALQGPIIPFMSDQMLSQEAVLSISSLPKIFNGNLCILEFSHIFPEKTNKESSFLNLSRLPKRLLGHCWCFFLELRAPGMLSPMEGSLNSSPSTALMIKMGKRNKIL